MDPDAADAGGAGDASVYRHRKSRNGCTRCRERRVKCDEQAPCGNCVRRGEDCNLELHREIHSNVVSKATSIPQIGDLEWSLDIYLMHHYTLETCKTLLPNDSSVAVFQKWIPETAMHQPELTRGVLAVSASHLATKTSADQALWLKLAAKSQTIASAALRRALTDVTEETVPVVFMLSILLGVTSLATMWRLSSPTLDDLIDTFLLLPGDITRSSASSTTSIAAQFWPLLLGFDFTAECASLALPAPIAAQLAAVRAVISRTTITPADRAALLATLQQLEALYREVVYMNATANHTPPLVWKWAGQTSVRFVGMLRNKHPCALVVFAYFVLLSSIFDDMWYFRNWAAMALDCVAAALVAPWHGLMAWPLEQLQTKLSAFRVI